MPTHHLTRRQFLHSAAATLAAPYLITSSALGQNGQAPANDRIGIGFIGLGGMGGGHFNGYLGHGRTRIVAVCDVNAATREQYRQRAEEKYPGVAAYNDFRELLARDDIDAVVIATPDHWHAIISIEAAKAGKDIYCEKPLSLTIREAQEMRETARRHDVVFQTGSQQRSSREFRQACELVRNARIGQVQTIHVNVGGPSGERVLPAEPVPEGFDYEMWLGPAPWKPYNKQRVDPGGWRALRDYSGGQMTDWGAHHFDIAQWGLGMDGSGPVEIIPPDGKEHKMLTYKYANGVLMYHGGGVNGLKFTGTDGWVEVNRGYLRTSPEALATAPIPPYEIKLYNSNHHREDWLNCIQTRQRPVADVAIGASSVTVCHLGNIAYWLKRPIRWDPVKEEIIGDDEARRWIDRPKRAPWHL
ncbi:MAG: Gfo/Idh/MocA family oxidoreductase [Armatimonadota bacterium]|nr:Gfo/Idh/MocA family oxidoreductase [Armatimonadota bacterium]